MLFRLAKERTINGIFGIPDKFGLAELEKSPHKEPFCRNIPLRGLSGVLIVPTMVIVPDHLSHNCKVGHKPHSRPVTVNAFHYFFLCIAGISLSYYSRDSIIRTLFQLLFSHALRATNCTTFVILKRRAVLLSEMRWRSTKRSLMTTPF